MLVFPASPRATLNLWDVTPPQREDASPQQSGQRYPDGLTGQQVCRQVSKKIKGFEFLAQGNSILIFQDKHKWSEWEISGIMVRNGESSDFFSPREVRTSLSLKLNNLNLEVTLRRSGRNDTSPSNNFWGIQSLCFNFFSLTCEISVLFSFVFFTLHPKIQIFCKIVCPNCSHLCLFICYPLLTPWQTWDINIEVK